MRPYNMQLLTATSGMAAISMLDSKDIDLVFMDHMMPEMDGVEATGIIRSMEGDYYKNLPIIALTANAINGAREMFMESGFNDFIAKPIELSVLDRVLKKWLPTDKTDTAVSSNYGRNDRRKSMNNSAKKDGETISVSKGIVYTGGSESVYFEILQMYVKKGEEKITLINRLAAEENWKDYVIEVHALKSTSLSIGSVKLSEFAKKLELAGKAGDYDVIRKENEALMKLYENVLKEGRGILIKNGVSSENESDNPDFTAEPLTYEKLCEYLSLIEESCNSFDSDEIIRIAKEALKYSYNEKPLKIWLDKIIVYAEEFEYEGALCELHNMQEELGAEK